MIPKIPVGRTGHDSSRAIFGAAGIGNVTQAEADRALEQLLAYGVNHIDTADSYVESELRIGPWMPAHRQDFFLASKTGDCTFQTAKDSIHRSLERLRTDHLDGIGTANP
jgi:aryl-alcohol dehydrogenase-like predicted oxidoreductase